MLSAKITYDFTIFPNDPVAYTLNAKYAKLYEQNFDLLNEKFGDVILEFGAYRVKYVENDFLATATIKRVYYY